MKRPVSHLTGELGELRFSEVMLKRRWLVTKLTPDYGFDFVVQPVDRDRVTPHFALFQVKAKESRLRVSDSGLRTIRLRRAHIEFWSKVPMPAFVAVVETPTGRVFCVHVEQCVQAAAKSTARVVPVKFSADSELDEMYDIRLRRAIGAYWAEMREATSPANSVMAAALVGKAGPAAAGPLSVFGNWGLLLVMKAVVGVLRRWGGLAQERSELLDLPRDVEQFKTWYRRQVPPWNGGA